MADRVTRTTGVALLLAFSIAFGAASVSVATADTIHEESEGDVGDIRSNATEIDEDNTVITGTVISGDVDWYAVELDTGDEFSAHLKRRENNGNENIRIRISLYGPDGKRIAVSSSRGSQTNATGNGTEVQTSLRDVIEQSGTYYVKVAAIKKRGGEKTPYALVVTQSPSQTPDEHNSNEHPTQVVPIESGEHITGVLTGNDSEYFSIETDAGDVISIETTFAASSKSTGTVYVYGPRGEQIHKSTTGDMQITAEKSGTYTIKIVSDTKATGVLNYTLTATLSPNQPWTTDKARHITTGEIIENSIASVNDTDWYAVELEKGQGFTVTLKHTNRKNPSVEISFEVYGPNGNRIGETPFDRPLRAYHTSPAASAYGGDVVERSGTYYIAVKGKSGASYSLSVNTVKLDEHDPNEQPAFATPIDLGTTVSGVLTGYDRDVYSLNLQKGDTVSIKYNSSEAFTLSLWVASPNIRGQSTGDYSFGKYTIASSANGNTLTFTANRTGTYYIKAVPYFERSTKSTFFERITYDLTIHASEQHGKVLTLKQRTSTTAPSTATVTLNTSTPTQTSTPSPTPTLTPTPTPTSTETATLTETSTATQTTVNGSNDTPMSTPTTQTTSTNGPGFGVLVSLLSFCGGAWWYRSHQ